MRSSRSISLPAAALALCLLAAARAGVLFAGAPDKEARPAAAAVDYNRDVRPVLSRRCYACHGPDEGRREAKLRLDVREAAVRKAIRPGDAARSPLIARVSSADPDERMPPPESKLPPLSAAEVDVLRRWIDAGAPYDQHWAYVRPVRPPLPEVEDRAWPRNPIDYFVAAGHREQGMRPSPAADPVTLARRLSIDLTGLPPSPEEADAFARDPSPGAYGRLVDRLLASPRFGERMASHWLDLVRYADTNGYHADLHRNIHPYRDYVINAFNRNLPFDEFTIEQLAGDLLPSPTTEQLVASGYNRLNQTTTEGGAQEKEYLAKYAADRVRNTATIWLGSTMGCCECHDHKYDPFTTRDFYSFAAFFADLKQVGVYPNRIEADPEVKVPSRAQAERLQELDRGIAAIEETLKDRTPEITAAQAVWEEDLRQRPAAWTILRPGSVRSEKGADLAALEDGSILAGGKSPDADTYTLAVRTGPGPITALRVEALPHASLPAMGPGRASNGNFVLTEIAIEILGEGSAARPLPLRNASASFSQGDPFSPAGAIDGKLDVKNNGWAVAGRTGEASELVLEAAAALQGPLDLRITLRQVHGGAHALGRFRLSATAAPPPVRALPAGIAAIAAVAPAQRTGKQAEDLAAYYLGIAPGLAPARARLEELRGERGQLLAAAPSTMVSVAVERRATRVLPRGNWLDDSGEAVSPAVPRFLPQIPAGENADRLALARWLVSRENPLPARVFANRLWRLFFGNGLAEPLDDLGSQGTRPSHLELLDWLAVEFIDSGWDVKRLARLMVTSAAYRQASEGTPELRARDPQNRWLARQSRFRLPAEMVRDSALAASGLLCLKIGGRSVKPYQPEGYWDHCNTFLGKLVYDQDHGEDLYRRGLYTYWKRTFPHPSLIAFDAPSREECTAERARSNTPLQALVLLNDPTYVEAARILAARIIREGGADPAARAAWAFRRVLARAPEPRELAVLEELYRKHRSEYAADPESAARLLGVGEQPPPPEIDRAELAAWTSVSRALLNLNEAVTRR